MNSGGLGVTTSSDIDHVGECIERVAGVKLRKYKTLFGLLQGRAAFNRHREKQAQKRLPDHNEYNSVAMTETPFVQREGFNKAIECRALHYFLDGKHVPQDAIDPDLAGLMAKHKQHDANMRKFVANKLRGDNEIS